jgi:hypothetical protein
MTFLSASQEHDHKDNTRTIIFCTHKFASFNFLHFPSFHSQLDLLAFCFKTFDTNLRYTPLSPSLCSFNLLHLSLHFRFDFPLPTCPPSSIAFGRLIHVRGRVSRTLHLIWISLLPINRFGFSHRSIVASNLSSHSPASRAPINVTEIVLFDLQTVRGE